jgi:hypothetical protein
MEGDSMSATATLTTAPAATKEPQHLRALARANEVRLARAELKRRIADGEIAVADVIRDCPWEAASMPVAELLMSQRRWGVNRCRRVLQAIPVPENKPVGAMTDRQRNELVVRLAPND